MLGELTAVVEGHGLTPLGREGRQQLGHGLGPWGPPLSGAWAGPESAGSGVPGAPTGTGPGCQRASGRPPNGRGGYGRPPLWDAGPGGGVGVYRKRGGLPDAGAGPVWSCHGAAGGTKHGLWCDFPGHGRSGRWSRGRRRCRLFPGPDGRPPAPETNRPAIRPGLAGAGPDPGPAWSRASDGPKPVAGRSRVHTLWFWRCYASALEQSSMPSDPNLPRFGALSIPLFVNGPFHTVLQW